VACVENNERTRRVGAPIERIAHVKPEALLHLRARRDDINKPSNVAEAENSVGRNVRHMGNSAERQQVVFAHRPKFNIANNDGVVRVDVGGRAGLAQASSRIDTDAAIDFVKRVRNPLRGLLESWSIRVLSDSSEYFTHRRGNASLVDRHG
jgi:hypothetical protein